MAAREAHGSKPKSNGNRNASVVSYDKASFESLDGSCASSESHVISPHPGSRELPPSRDERVDGWLRSTLRTEEPVQPAARASVTGGDLIAAAAAGDLEALRRASPSGVDEGNFDGRTCLHLAASNGRLDVVACLVDELGAATNVIDRWGGTPLDDAVRHSHAEVKEFLEGRGAARGVSPPGEGAEGAD